MMRKWLLFVVGIFIAVAVCAQNRLVSEEVYKGLMKVEELLEQKDETAALNVLQGLVGKRSLDNYGRVLVLQMLGVVYFNQENYEQARVSFEKILDSEEVPQDFLSRARYNLAQVHILQENYRSAIQVLQADLGNKEEPGHEVAFLLASAFAALSEYKTALYWMEKIITDSTIETLPENYLAFAASLNLSLEHYAPAVKLLEVLVRRYSAKAIYWRQLVSAHLGSDDNKAAFTALQLGYIQGVLKQEKDIKQLARFYLHRHLPYKAAVLLRDEMKAGKVKDNIEIRKLLAVAWNQAREYDAAIPLLEQLTQQADNGKPSLRLAHIYVDKEKWAGALKWINDAIKKGKLQYPAQAYLLKGIIQVHLKQHEAAETTFLHCMKFKKIRKQAIEWLEFLGDQAVH